MVVVVVMIEAEHAVYGECTETTTGVCYRTIPSSRFLTSFLESVPLFTSSTMLPSHFSEPPFSPFSIPY